MKNVCTLSLQQLSVCYGQIQALKNVTLDVMQGESVAIIGANGAGKSSLFDVISGLVDSSSGQIYFCGKRIEHFSVEQRVRLGVMRSFQRSRLFASLTVQEHLQCAAQMRSPSTIKRDGFWRIFKGDAQGEEYLKYIASCFGLPLNASILELSYAHQRLLELGMMLVADAKLMLLDEPTSGLSVAEANLFLTLLNKYAQGKTILFIEHDMQVVHALANKVFMFEHGQLIAT